MEYVRVRKTDLARNTSQIIRNVLRGQTAVIESHGQPEVAMMDMMDFRLQRAAMEYFSNPQKHEAEIGINESDLKAASADVQAHYDLVLGQYLAVRLSLARAGEALGMNSHELRMRLERLGIPLRVGPESVEGIKEEIKVIENLGNGT